MMAISPAATAGPTPIVASTFVSGLKQLPIRYRLSLPVTA
jgi:hypothetical protein